MARKAKNDPVAEDRAAAPPPIRKTDLVLELLRREEGATLAEITGATGWLPHSARAVLTGLRKKGHSILREKRDAMTCYRIDETA